MFRAVRLLFARAYVLYVFLFVLLWAWLDRREVSNDVINLSKFYGDDLYQFAYGRLAWDQDRLNKGAAYYKTLITRMPNPALAYGNLGFCYFYLKQEAQAAEAYKKAIAYDPAIYTFYFDLGYMALVDKDWGTAAKFFGKSIELISSTINDLGETVFKIRATQDFVMAHVYLDQAYEGSGQFKAERLKQILNLHLWPNDFLFFKSHH